MIWLVLVSMSHPLAEPKMVRKFKTEQECVNAAVNSNHAGQQIGPLHTIQTPKGKFYLCMKPVYPT